MQSSSDKESLAEELLAALDAGEQFEPLSARIEGFDEAVSYRIAHRIKFTISHHNVYPTCQNTQPQQPNRRMTRHSHCPHHSRRYKHRC